MLTLIQKLLTIQCKVSATADSINPLGEVCRWQGVWGVGDRATPPRQFALSTKKPRFGRGFFVLTLCQSVVIAMVRSVRFKKRLATVAILFEASQFDALLSVCLPVPYVEKLDFMPDMLAQFIIRQAIEVFRHDSLLLANNLRAIPPRTPPSALLRRCCCACTTAFP